MANYPTSIAQPLELALGPYTKGEIPEALVVTLRRKEDNSIISLNDALDVATFRFGRINEGATGMKSQSASIDDVNDTVIYEWSDGDLDLSGYWHGVIWVARGGRRLATQAISFVVYEPPFDAP